MRIGLELNRQALAFEVVQALELKARGCHQGVTHVEKRGGFLQATGFVVSIGGQGEDCVTFAGRIAQRPALVKREPPCVVDGRCFHALGDQLGQVNVQAALWAFGFAEGQVVWICAHAQRLSRKERCRH